MDSGPDTAPDCSAPDYRRPRRLVPAVWLLAIDLVFVPAGRIPPTYLLDAAMEVGWLAAWARQIAREHS
ncbi:hypothetical protein [Nocardia farcinica]|uniref:hypothetical protein n=1 Tax=Nocardia farcinica TaxID=37329 RepID=UPI0018940888|nr:hypothetical protein [Nocardia farcinica]MBF6519204.1 hypothetical protein [Nocardia farcinica]